MALRISGKELVEQATKGKYTGLPYSAVDCQGFVEMVLDDCGVRKSDGSVYNWRGSNSMWRNYIKWKGTIEECRKKFGCIPLGAFVFIVKNDGGERERGYHDDQGNASHVGLYVGGPLPVMDSQGNRGVDYCSLGIFTHVGLMSMIDYTTENNEQDDPEGEYISLIGVLRDSRSTDAEWLYALKNLTKYLKGV